MIQSDTQDMRNVLILEITNLGKGLAVFSTQEEFSQLSLLLKYSVEELNLVRPIRGKHRHHILERSNLEFPENIFSGFIFQILHGQFGP